ncbi:hypothetical protein [Actinomyces naeslundii]|jgi:hypothetical protein|uniref:hypothetical protein n=1 Tax=Actinomyces naeslundii TaxID=1655 RepID=UPI001178213B|nr:hypothetical protein [Actinomyces naeslundii]
MNPAALLFDQLTKYRTATGNVSLLERWHTSDDETTIINDADRAALLESTKWLTDINAIIDTLDNMGRKVGPFRRNYSTWVDSTLNIGKSWSSPYTPEEVCPQAALDSLETLADMVDVLTPSLSTPLRDQLISLANELADGLEADTTLSDQLRDHLRRTVECMRRCLENPGECHLQNVVDATDNAITAAKAAAGESTDSVWKEQWRQLSTAIVYPTISGLIANVPSMILQITGSAS